MQTNYARLNFGPYWRMTNENLIELIDLVPEDNLDWSPREGEWTFHQVALHLMLARYHGPLVQGHDGRALSDAIQRGQSKEGLKELARISWDLIEAFISDPAKLDAVYEPHTGGVRPLVYTDEPETYDGHYVAYHRMAHDLHHRSTIIGYLGQLGISLDGRRIRPL